MTDHDETRPTPPEPRFDPVAGASPGESDRPRSGSDPDATTSPTGSGRRRARFQPGAVIGERYRIATFLGRGGMGEVYLADDMRLDQQVALKFLPEQASQDASWRERLQNEVRLARQVSHKHVCRVYDIGETSTPDGALLYLSMEYVDGEDLASLLRRIGRLPRDKAVAIARQLCAGLHAAHAEGVLHRDLKPANIMLDGRGDARITDFGVAGVAEQLTAEDARAGTPAYMAPEQLRGESVSIQSDIYALGLVLYELFTGSRAHSGETVDALRHERESSAPSAPSTVIHDMDPVVERVILRCLSPEPHDRPASAMSVAAALPGGDPLAAALAAGETPSPELVAASGGEGAMRPRTALLCAALTLVMAAAFVWSNQPLKRWGLLEGMVAPAVAEDRAREALRVAGHDPRAAHERLGVETDHPLLTHILQFESDRAARIALQRSARPSTVAYIWRGSPMPIVTSHEDIHPAGMSSWDPPFWMPNERMVHLHADGSLRTLRVLTPWMMTPGAADVRPDWPALFALAGLDFDGFEPDEPTLFPPLNAESRLAWKRTGADADDPFIPVRVEAAERAGRVVFFRALYGWDMTGASGNVEQTRSLMYWIQIVTLILMISIGVGSIVMAWRHVRIGRGDRRGAMTLMAIAFPLTLLATALAMVVSPLVLGTHFPRVIGMSLFSAFFLGVMYLAVEPIVRRSWPQVLTAWSRLLAGRWRDPLVGRSLLLGAVAGAAAGMLHQSGNLASFLTTGVAADAGRASPLDWLSIRWGFVGLAAVAIAAPLMSFLYVVLLVALRAALRKPWLWAPAFLLLGTLLLERDLFYNATILPGALIITALRLVLIMRCGVLAAAAFEGVRMILRHTPLLPDLQSWQGATTVFWGLVLLAFLAYATHTAIGAHRPTRAPASV